MVTRGGPHTSKLILQTTKKLLPNEDSGFVCIRSKLKLVKTCLESALYGAIKLLV